ncbi:anthrone oxygenase family protein [Nostoc sp. UHCC 0251]|uniref:anthrone oxygenase family protein n=1 Tax=Nostoc sp. UHCC 0251 TaxID=3110240 RepID=UPI002B1F9609|nr:anthrone oxygenase family protein [Nostoc sp. UHCC 0251]MEA5627987.1 anthrone oxygenase family protein [Nostoc sp. UHCC 0251]
MALCHTLELPAKMQYSASQYIAIQNSLYVAFGPPNIGAFIEFAAPLAAIALAVLVRKRRPAFQLTLLAIAFMLLAFPVIFFAFTEPANRVIRSATPEAIPANWEQLRYQWEYSHLARFFCHLAAFSTLLLSVLGETPARYLRGQAE